MIKSCYILIYNGESDFCIMDTAPDIKEAIRQAIRNGCGTDDMQLFVGVELDMAIGDTIDLQLPESICDDGTIAISGQD